MNKLTATILIALMPFILTACTTAGKKPAEMPVTTDSGTTQEKPENKTEDKSNVFTSIKDAVTKQIGLKCDYVDEDGQSIETYIKGDKVYLTGEQKNGDEVVLLKGIMRDQKYYLWGNKTNEGLVFSLKNETGDETTTMGDTEINSQEDVIKKLEENKDKCKPVAIEASMFDLPSDITFKEFDLSGLMQ